MCVCVVPVADKMLLCRLADDARPAAPINKCAHGHSGTSTKWHYICVIAASATNIHSHFSLTAFVPIPRTTTKTNAFMWITPMALALGEMEVFAVLFELMFLDLWLIVCLQLQAEQVEVVKGFLLFLFFCKSCFLLLRVWIGGSVSFENYPTLHCR